ncbi:hypothetical protein LTR95_018828 [Oleoguttula sp. CCFEE 5521]
MNDIIDTSTNRLSGCWKSSDCNSCTQNKHGCGWCPVSATCVPANGLLDPVSNADICPLRDERFELRTKALGCGCSTTSLLAVLITILATIAGLLTLYGIVKLLLKLNEAYGTGAWRGWEVEVKDDGAREGKPWSRSKKGSWFGHNLSKRSEQDEVTARTRLLA